MRVRDGRHSPNVREGRVLISRTRRALDIVGFILAIGAVGTAGWIVYEELQPVSPKPPIAHGPLRITPVAEWQRFGQTGQRRGVTNAKVVVVEFADFQCPFCVVAAPTLEALRGRFPSSVATVFRHLPLESIHRWARPAALAAECAALQGRFQAFHDVLFAHQDMLGVWSWGRFASLAGVPDTLELALCTTNGTSGARLAEDLQAARDLHLNGTPAFLVNGSLIVGYVPVDSLASLIEGMLVRTSRAGVADSVKRGNKP